MNRLREHVESIQWGVGRRAFALGTNVILEMGFWSRDERNSYRMGTEALEAEVELHYLNVDLDELWKRLNKRNAELPAGTFHINHDEMEQ